MERQTIHWKMIGDFTREYDFAPDFEGTVYAG